MKSLRWTSIPSCFNRMWSPRYPSAGAPRPVPWACAADQYHWIWLTDSGKHSDRCQPDHRPDVANIPWPQLPSSQHPSLSRASEVFSSVSHNVDTSIIARPVSASAWRSLLQGPPATLPQKPPCRHTSYVTCQTLHRWCRIHGKVRQPKNLTDILSKCRWSVLHRTWNASLSVPFSWEQTNLKTQSFQRSKSVHVVALRK